MSSAQHPLTAEQFAEQVSALVQQFAYTQEVQRADALTIDRRMLEAGRIRQQWKRTEDALPALMAEAHREGWSAEQIAGVLDVSESYVYRKLREQSSE